MIKILVFYHVHMHVYNDPARYALSFRLLHVFCEVRVVRNELQDLPE